jgi:glutamate dehydrogenase
MLVQAACAPTSSRSARTARCRSRQIAIKFESRKIDGLPLPRPLYEIFVYSPRVEGVHLRFGKVARGGIRWSDRPQDFRTEVLGLVKAQQVKNAVIVPVGAKGGFVPKLLPPAATREAWQAEGVEAYKLFISHAARHHRQSRRRPSCRPPNVVRHDGDDPYLVVAADKGTATFSDIANALSARAHGFWLGDAFASGGSAGYDHKKMGITARGAWEAVKRHFREMDIDIQTTPFTVVGVGDMSGDVFGNGMLRRADDQARRRLRPPRHLHRSRSRSGGELRPSASGCSPAALELAGLRQGADLEGRRRVPARAKSIALSPEAQALLGLAKAQATPQEVMRDPEGAGRPALVRRHRHLCARLAETDAEVGDRANDAIRVTGAELRAKVIGEGANLGMTQRGRIEAARPACGSTPTPSTIRPASTPPTSRSTSRSR